MRGWAGMSGYEFLAKSRAQWPDLPVLMITAYATPEAGGGGHPGRGD